MFILRVSNRATRILTVLVFVSVLIFSILSNVTRVAAQQETRYGVAHDHLIMSSEFLAKARESGFGWLRYFVYWSRANPTEDVYDWTYIDFTVSQAEATGLKLYMNLGEPPQWVLALPAAPLQAAFEKFARAMVLRYKGRVHAWGWGSEVHNVWPALTAADFVERILAPGYRISKTLDPGADVVGPDADLIGSPVTRTEGLRDLLLLEDRFGKWCDVISFHILKHSLDKDDQRGLNRLAQLNDVIAERGGGRLVWITELGVMGQTGDCNDERAQAFWLAQALQDIASRPWIAKTFIYRLLDGPEAGFQFGLLYADGSGKSAMHELRTLLTGATPKTFLAEGASGAFFDLDVALANPYCTEVPARVTFLRPDGSTVVHGRTLAPRSRQTIRVDDVPGVQATDASTVVESLTGPPVIVERTMFWDHGYYAGHTGTAVTRPETRWYFGEGSQGFFDTYVLLANSGATPANVTVRFLRESGGPVNQSFTVKPTARLTVFAGHYPALAGMSFSIAVESDQPIIAERAMYFGQAPFYNGGHESAGVSAPATNWFHAEGATGSYFDTYVLVGNPNDAPANVTFSFLLETGRVITRTRTIAPQARLTVNVELEDAALADAAVSTTVSADIPIVSERAMYWPGPSTTWHEAHNSFGVTETSMRWALAEGRVGGPRGFETYVLIANPTTTAAQVRMTFLRNGAPSTVKVVTVPPTSRFNVYVNELVDGSGTKLVSNEEFGALIESTNFVPIVVERAMYWNAVVNGQLQIWAGGTNATATRLP